MKITTHTIVKNDENWIWYSLMSVKDQVSDMLVIDDASDDKTVEIIKTISDPKIKLLEKKLATPAQFTKARNDLVEKTKTDWFLLLDGDEIWNRETLRQLIVFLESQPKTILSVAMRTRNCIGDIYHFLPESAGKYEILGRKGHLTIRAYRKLPGLSWTGDYPLEKYDIDEKHLAFFEGYYWHMTHLPRTSSKSQVKGWRKIKLEKGINVSDPNDFPEVFNLTPPRIVPSPWKRRGPLAETLAKFMTPIKYLKRKYAG